MNMKFRVLLVLPLIGLAAPSLAQPDPDRLAERLMEADADGNGAVSRAEMAQWRRSQWTRMDRNNDGFFSREDLPRFARSKWENGRPADLRQRFDANRDFWAARWPFSIKPIAMATILSPG
jgi:Ca2+-binding EF-hand superfamily protein